MRIGEVCALTLDCIDFEEGTIKVYRTLTRDKADKVIMIINNEKEKSLLLRF